MEVNLGYKVFLRAVVVLSELLTPSSHFFLFQLNVYNILNTRTLTYT